MKRSSSTNLYFDIEANINMKNYIAIYVFIHVANETTRKKTKDSVEDK